MVFTGILLGPKYLLLVLIVTWYDVTWVL